jgi:hypothetical protein
MMASEVLMLYQFRSRPQAWYIFLDKYLQLSLIWGRFFARFTSGLRGYLNSWIHSFDYLEGCQKLIFLSSKLVKSWY